MAVAIEAHRPCGHVSSGFAPDPVADRIAEVERGRHARLLARAQALRLMVDPDYCRADACIVWSPINRGRCEVVSMDSCSCREFRLWGACPHHAAVVEALGGRS